jgi:hypothetical protein
LTAQTLSRKMTDPIRDLFDASIQDRIANNRERPIWLSPELFYELQEVGMIRFEDSGAFYLGHSLRVIPEMSQDYKFANA